MTSDEDLWKLEHRTLIQIGNSVGITIHTDEREKLGLEKGDQLILKVRENDEIVLKPLSSDT